MHNEMASIGFHATGAFGSGGGYEAQQSYNALNPSTPFPLAPSFGFLGQFKKQKNKTYPGSDSANAIGLVLEDDIYSNSRINVLAGDADRIHSNRPHFNHVEDEVIIEICKIFLMKD